jgi:hypothetical protein
VTQTKIEMVMISMALVGVGFWVLGVGFQVRDYSKLS